uniref:Multifunctional fusion protein n=1 Tax=Spyridia filamentosa TaxID=196632 RepID=A0A1Z1MKB7_SPYFI|nr:translation elongation factor Ts [Spyridia filamentosa]ARW66204.1 translation elongation factor Ts [Spyridia filamentosa]
MSQNISSDYIKELRLRTGAGMLDCKKALQISEQDIDAAVQYLRKKGLASAEKKSSRIATEGVVDSYIHAGSRIGVLVELNCETDFVARQKEFQQLARHISMQIAACQSVQYISLDDVPENIILNEKAIEASKDDLADKPSSIKDKIIAGRIEKRLKEITLMNQAFIKDPNICIQELIKQHIALLGENIKIRRFTRFILGEGLDKKEYNFKNEIESIIS